MCLSSLQEAERAASASVRVVDFASDDAAQKHTTEARVSLQEELRREGASALREKAQDQGSSARYRITPKP